MKNISIGFIITMILFSASLKSQSSSRQSMLADSKVITGLSEYLEKIPIGQEYYFGFKSREDFGSIDLGEPFQIYTINHDSIEIESKAIKETDLWYIPVMVEGMYCCFLHVQKSNATYQAVGIGYNEMARDLEVFEKQNVMQSKQHKALLIDNSLGLFCFTCEDELFYPIRKLSKCSECSNVELIDALDAQTLITYSRTKYNLL